MSDKYERYQSGFHQEVYDELLAMQERIYEPGIYEEALSVMRAMMKRVRSNIEQIIGRLETLGYLFRKGGFWENYSPEKKVGLEREYPTFHPPTSETLRQVDMLEQFTGPLPLSLKCWYQEVGSVNLVGLFAGEKRESGPGLDPLWVNPIEVALQQVRALLKIDEWEQEPLLILAPDRHHKYGYSGAGSYNILLPCKAVDAPFLNEPHHTTFVNYLRICFQWGGLPGLEQEHLLSHEQLEYLTQGLLPF